LFYFYIINDFYFLYFGLKIRER